MEVRASWMPASRVVEPRSGSIVLHEMIFVVENILEALAALSEGANGTTARRHQAQGAVSTGLPRQVLLPAWCQERIVAHNTVCSSWPVTREPGWSGSGVLPARWLALSEFRYCRHNAGFCLVVPRKPLSLSGLTVL